MERYEVEVREVHVATYTVTAESEADAIQNALYGEHDGFCSEYSNMLEEDGNPSVKLIGG